MYKVFIFSSVHRYDDTRILYKQAKSLSKNYKVELHAPSPFKEKKINNVKVVGLPQWKNINDRSKIRKIIWKRIKDSNADIFHFHDPELLWIGIKIKLFIRKPVIYDIHEDHSKAILSKVWIPKFFRLPVSYIFSLIELFFGRIINNLIYTTTIIGEKFGNVNKIGIYNYPFKNNIKNNKSVKNLEEIIYVGGITKIRGFVEIIDSLNILKKRGVKFNFKIIGPIQHKDFKDQINDLILKYDLKENIEFLGLLPYNEIFRHIESAIVGLLCYLPEPNHLVTFPNKIFEYISVGTAVIASDFPLYRHIIKDTNSGILVNPSNSKDIAEKILYSLNNPKKMIEYGENGKKNILNRYNWEMEEIKLIKYYEGLL